MIARLTRFMILLQLMTLAAVSLLFLQLGVFSALPYALLTSALLLMLLRAFIIFNNYFLSHALRQPLANGSSAPAWPLMRRMLQEFYWSLVCWFRLFPLARARVVHFDRSQHLPVLMLHGYGANSGFWQSYSEALSHQCISHATLDLEPLLADIDDYAPLIEDAVETLCKTTGTAHIILLCHSMGGLAARAWLRLHGSERVAKIVTLGTPHFGSTLASYGMGINARQMIYAPENTGSWLAQLDQSEDAELRALFVSFYSRHDNIVSPQHSAILPGACNMSLDLIGHVALGFDTGVRQAVLKQINVSR